MQMSKRAHRWIGLHNAIFYLLLLAAIALLGYLSNTLRFTADWTYGNRNSLAAPTTALLQSLQQPLKFVAYIPDRPDIAAQLRKTVEKYRRIKPDTQIEFVDPNLDPVRAKQDGIQYAGQLLIRLGERSEVVDNTSEQTIANAIQRLSRGGERLVVFLEGHGERNPLADTSVGMSQLVAALARNGFKVQPHNLIRTQALPANATFVVIAAPQQDLTAGEVAILQKYVENGGNLLWLHDPGGLRGLQPLEELLGIHIHDGTVVDANQTLQALLGINHPAVVPVVDYSNAEVVRKLAGMQTLFPFATVVERDPQAEAKEGGLAWQADEFLMTLPTSWLESSGTLEGAVKFDEGSNDKAGPVPLGVTLVREVAADSKEGQKEAEGKGREQRVAVLGDSDFMLNALLAQGANLDLATNLFNWLSADDNLLHIPLIRAPDTELNLSETSGIVIGVFFLVVLPLGLLLAGVWIWWRRRSR